MMEYMQKFMASLKTTMTRVPVSTTYHASLPVVKRTHLGSSLRLGMHAYIFWVILRFNNSVFSGMVCQSRDPSAQPFRKCNIILTFEETIVETDGEI